MTRNPRLRAACGVALALLLSVSPLPAAHEDLNKGITLDLKDADLRLIFGLYKDILGVELEIDPAIEGTISITFDDITVRTSLNAICESAKCRWSLTDGYPGVLRIAPLGEPGDPAIEHGGEGGPPVNVVATHGPVKEGYGLESPVSLKLVDADAITVLETAAKLINARLLLGRDLKGKTVTVNATGVPLSTVLDTACDELGCSWELAEGDPPTLSVYYP